MALKLQGLGHLPFERDEYYKHACEYLGVPYGTLPTKKEIYDDLGYRILPTLEKVHRSRATHRILSGGNRSGKSQGATWEIIPYLFFDTHGWVVSANYNLASIIMEKIVEILIERAGLKRVRRPDNLQEFEFAYINRDHYIQMWTGAILEAKSTENPDSMHGVSLDYVVIDEASLFPYALYDTRVVPRLVDSGGWVLSVGTFEFLQGEWFEEYFEIGQVENNLSIQSWHHPTADNFHRYVARGGETPEQLADYYRDNARKIMQMNPNVSWPLKPGTEVFIYNVDLEWLAAERNRIPPEVYDARYNALRAPNQYLVFPSWQVTEYAGAEARKRTQFDPDLPVYLGVDPGGTYAVAVIQLKRFPEEPYTNEIARGYHVCIIDTIYHQTTVTTNEIYEEMKTRPWFPNVGRRVSHWDHYQGAIDVTQKEQQRVFYRLAQRDTDIDKLVLHGKKVAVEDGAKTLQHYLDTHTLWSNPNNRFLHVEFARYHYQNAPVAKVDTQDPRKGSRPVDEWNHLLKAVWYFLVGKFGYYGRSQASAVAGGRRR